MNSDLKAIAVGRLVPVKRFDVLIEAWRNIPNQISIVGDGPERDKLISQVNELGLQDRVHFLGERSDVLGLLADYQLVVVTSEREGFGYVLLEALQANLVAISTATGIATDLLPQDYLIDSLTANNVTYTITRTLSDFERAKQAFEPVWNVAREMTVKKMVLETLRTYQTTLSRGNDAEH